MWQIPVLLKVMVIYPYSQYLIKKSTSLPGRVQRLFWMYLFCAVISLIFAGWQGITLNASFWMIVGIGMASSTATYCQWRAIDISLSKTGLFTNLDDLIGLALGYLILHEEKYLTSPFLITGVVLCFGATALLTLKRDTGEMKRNLSLIGWVLGYSITWGVVYLIMRYLALQGTSAATWTLGWYGGSFLGTVVIRAVARTRQKEIALSKSALVDMLHLAAVIWANMYLFYWAMQLAPITIVQPIIQVDEVIAPVIVGLLIFKEKATLAIPEKWAYAVGIAGAFMITLSF